MSLNYVTWHSYWTSFLSGPKICNFDFLYLKWYICRILPLHSGRWVGTGYQCVGHLGKAQHMENEEIFFKKNLKPEHHKVAFASSHVSLTSASHPPAVNLRINCFQRSLHFCIPPPFHFLQFRFVWQVSNAFATLHTCHPLFANRTSFSHRYFSDECAPLWQVSCSFQFISRAPHLAAFFAQNSFALTVSHFLSRRHILLGFLPTQQILHHFGSFKITPSIPFHFLASLFLLQARAPTIQYIVEFLHCTLYIYIVRTAG